MASTRQNVGFIGAGKMATAMAGGFISAKVFEADDLFASCPRDWDSSDMKKIGVTIYEENPIVIEKCSVLILAVKPDIVSTVLKEISSVSKNDGKLIISVAAGITLKSMEEIYPGRIVRVVPNTPALNPGYGATALCPNDRCSDEDARLAERMFQSLGFCCRVPEYLMDAVTGLSGSGPAFIFTIIEALADGGVKMGLHRDLASKLAAQTVLGSAKLVIETGLHPAVLRDSVASPGGTTIHGLHALEAGGVRNALINAVEAATKRSSEMGK